LTVAKAEDEWCGRHRQQSPRGGKLGAKMNILSEKKINFLHSTNFKLLNRIQGNSQNIFIFYFLKFIISVRSAQGNENLATPLFYSHCQKNLQSHTNKLLLHPSWICLSHRTGRNKFADTYRYTGHWHVAETS